MSTTLTAQLDAIADKLFAARGECRWCGVYHPVKQCLNPRNASKKPYARLGAYEILDANRIAGELIDSSIQTLPKIVVVSDQPPKK